MPTKDKEKRKQQWKEWYERNKNDISYKKKIRDFDNNRRKDLSIWFQELKLGLKCKECGENHPATLDFHHRNPDEKLYEVSRMPSKSISKEKILMEIEKCDVLCANCHRKLHWRHKS